MERNAERMKKEDCTLERLVTTIPLADYVPRCVDVPRFLAYCKACPSYGTRWSCPPHDYDSMDLWARYEALSLVVLVITPHPGIGRDRALDILAREKNTLLEELLALEGKVPGSLVLSAGNCQLCRFCGRSRGEPCCHPEKMRPSIEALGGDVSRTLEHYLGRSIQWTKPGETPQYLTLAGGLLIPGGWRGGGHG